MSGLYGIGNTEDNNLKAECYAQAYHINSSLSKPLSRGLPVLLLIGTFKSFHKVHGTVSNGIEIWGLDNAKYEQRYQHQTNYNKNTRQNII